MGVGVDNFIRFFFFSNFFFIVEANASFPRFVPREPNFFPEASIPLSESENWHQDNQSLLAQPCCEKTMATALTTCDSAQVTRSTFS